MATKKEQIYKCSVCGNMIEVVHEGAGQLVCCNKPMDLLEEHTQDPEKGEKHLPVIEDNKVKVGSVEHPMEPEHFIEWIEAKNEFGNTMKVFLHPGDKPYAEFSFNPVSAREYCNLHGLWKV